MRQTTVSVPREFSEGKILGNGCTSFPFDVIRETLISVYLHRLRKFMEGVTVTVDAKWTLPTNPEELINYQP